MSDEGSGCAAFCCRERVQLLLRSGQKHDSYGRPLPRGHSHLAGPGCDGGQQLGRDALEQLEPRGKLTASLSKAAGLVRTDKDTTGFGTLWRFYSRSTTRPKW